MASLQPTAHMNLCAQSCPALSQGRQWGKRLGWTSGQRGTVRFDMGKDQVLRRNNPSCWKAVWQKGPGGPGGRHAEHEPAMCPAGKGHHWEENCQLAEGVPHCSALVRHQQCCGQCWAPSTRPTRMCWRESSHG